MTEEREQAAMAAASNLRGELSAVNEWVQELKAVESGGPPSFEGLKGKEEAAANVGLAFSLLSLFYCHAAAGGAEQLDKHPLQQEQVRVREYLKKTAGCESTLTA